MPEFNEVLNNRNVNLFYYVVFNLNIKFKHSDSSVELIQNKIAYFAEFNCWMSFLNFAP
ncbi:hypothetical protein TYM08_P0378 [Marinicellulosiphila megalodicopiae]